MLAKFLDNLQKKPYETRVRILWSTTTVLAILLIVIWIMSLKSTIKNGSNSAEQAPAKTQVVSVEFVKVERVEKSGSLMKIYFNLDNDTSDILNVPKTDDITLDVSPGSLHPSSILDRQGQPFVQKVLSKTQAFGILTFSNTTAATGQLIFDNMVFEKTADQPLKQVLTLDFTKLNQPANVRN